jgi:hypothetical protein
LLHIPDSPPTALPLLKVTGETVVC